jgi:CubicO group peptidase (beta-lactamase class C family)
VTTLTSLRDLDERVDAMRGQSGAPALAFAVSCKGATTASARGILNAETGVQARTDSLFQIGSITKSLTATLIMQAREEGLLDLDLPVSNYLRHGIGRGEAAGRFTARQLLAHTSGLDGDLFVDTGRDDDALAKYLIECEQLEFLASPDRYYNYSNAGYAALGRLLEVLRGKSFDEILRDRLFAPLGASRSTTFAEDAAFARTAVGHSKTADERGCDEKMSVVPFLPLPRALGPAGFTLYSTVEDLIAYANAHLAGELLLRRETAAQMQSPQVRLPDGTAWGLGWKIIDHGGVRFFGHDGGTIGQVASLWLAPQFGLAVALCANGGRARLAWEGLAHPVFQDVCGEVPRARVPQPVRDAPDLAAFEGTFENQGVLVRIVAQHDRLEAVAQQKYFSMPDTIFHMYPLGGDRFRACIGDDDQVVTAFMERGLDGRPALFYAGRLHRRRP